MSDTEWIESWHEYNDKNLPLSFADFCYRQGRADAIDEIEDEIINSFDDFNKKWTIVSVLHHIHELLEQFKEQKNE